MGDHGSEHVPAEHDSPCMLIKAIGLEKARHMRSGPSLDCVNVHVGAVSFVLLSSVDLVRWLGGSAQSRFSSQIVVHALSREIPRGKMIATFGTTEVS